MTAKYAASLPSLIVSALSLWLGALAYAAPANEPAAQNNATTTSVAISTQAPSRGAEAQIEITPRSSRPQIAAGSGFGINAEIKNRSPLPVYLIPRYLTIVPPPEISPGTPTDWWAVIMAPGTEPEDAEKASPEYQYSRVIEIAAGDSVTAFWAPSDDVCSDWKSALACVWKRKYLLNFSPGEFSIKINAIYWSDKASAETRALNYRASVAEAKVVVVAPEWVILTGAVLGGIIAYFLLPSARIRPNQLDLGGLLTSALISVIVTILLARLSDTQFLIRVSINDLWGAIAIGFIASSSGSSILQKYFHLDTLGTKAPAPSASSENDKLG